VKGVAGNLGIVNVQSAAQNLEKAIREGQHDSVHSLLDEFADSLSHQVTAMRLALHASEPAKPEEAPTTLFNGAEASDAIAHLRTLLAASDGASEEAFHDLQAKVKSVVEEPQLEALGNLINNFDFEGALGKLGEIAEVCARNGEQ
jgi:HPt (histidine-containing phosphotransfer) domain-containing protein